MIESTDIKHRCGHVRSYSGVPADSIAGKSLAVELCPKCREPVTARDAVIKPPVVGDLGRAAINEIRSVMVKYGVMAVNIDMGKREASLTYLWSE